MRLKNLLPDVTHRAGTGDYHPFYNLQREMTNLAGNFFRVFDISPRVFFNGTMGSFTPSIDMKETEKEFIIKAELPGVDEKDIEVKLLMIQ